MSWMLIVFLLVALGIALIAVEAVILPGLGFIGLLGAILVITSGVLAYRNLSGVQTAMAMSTGAASMLLMVWLLPTTKLAKSMALEAQISGTGVSEHLAGLVGQTGTCKTPLRPAGIIEIDGAPIDVVSDGEYIESGTPVRVALVDGNRVVVVAMSS